MSIKPHTIAAPSGNEIVIWAEPGKLDAFFTMPSPDTEVSPAAVAETVKGHSRRRYPGDSNPASVPQHQRDQLSGEPSKYPVLPGSNFYVEVPTTVNNKTTYDVTTATFQGNFTDLLQYILGNSLQEFEIRSPGGVAYNNGYTPGP